MKKVLLFVMTLTFLSVNAQKIMVDQMETDGSHQIMTNMKNFVIEDRDYSMTLKVYETANKLDWRVTMSTFNNIPNDNIILLKLKNGQTVSLAVRRTSTSVERAPSTADPRWSLLTASRAILPW